MDCSAIIVGWERIKQWQNNLHINKVKVNVEYTKLETTETTMKGN